jgi:hypothetical protein
MLPFQKSSGFYHDFLGLHKKTSPDSLRHGLQGWVVLFSMIIGRFRPGVVVQESDILSRSRPHSVAPRKPFVSFIDQDPNPSREILP